MQVAAAAGRRRRAPVGVRDRADRHLGIDSPPVIVTGAVAASVPVDRDAVEEVHPQAGLGVVGDLDEVDAVERGRGDAGPRAGRSSQSPARTLDGRQRVDQRVRDRDHAARPRRGRGRVGAGARRRPLSSWTWSASQRCDRLLHVDLGGGRRAPGSAARRPAAAGRSRTRAGDPLARARSAAAAGSSGRRASA